MPMQADLFAPSAQTPKAQPLAAELVPPELARARAELRTWERPSSSAPTNPATVYLASLQPGVSQYTMRRALAQLSELLAGHAIDPEHFPWGSVRYVHASWLRAQLVERYAPATCNKVLAALRRVLYEAFRLGQLPPDDYHRTSTLDTVAGTAAPAGRSLSAGELRALVEACAKDPHRGTRDTALLAVLYQGGLRRAEAVSIDLDDYNAETRTLTVRFGKGRKARLVYLDGAAADALAAWIAQRGSSPGPLFVGFRKGGRVQLGQRLIPESVLSILSERGNAAGVEHFSPHDLRRSALSDMLDCGVDLATVQRYAGHASPTTTTRYDRRGERTKRDAASKLHFPSASPRR